MLSSYPKALSKTSTQGEHSVFGSLGSLHRWLATTEDDHQIRRRLKVLVARGESTNYTVTTYTSDIKVAASACVWLLTCG